MSRGWGGAGLVAFGTFLAAWPMATLFEPRSWLRGAALMLTVVAVAGVLTRQRRLPGFAVVSVQGVAVAWMFVLTYATDTLFYGLPTASTLSLVADRFGDAISTIQRYAAPAPATAGVEVVLVLIVAVAGLAADALSETWLAPAAAGVPMLVLYLSAAANSGIPLNPAFFLAVAGVWATMVARRSEGRLRRWSTTIAMRRGVLSTRDDQDDVVGQVAHTARVTGVSVLVGALVVAALLPHLPTRYLVEGLGRGGLGGGSSGVIGLSSTLDVGRSLGAGRDDIILKYATDATRPVPLRVSVATTYVDGVWTSDAPDQTRAEEVPGPLVEPTPQLGQLTRKTVQFGDNSVPLPYLAVPDHVVAVNADPAEWRWRPSTTEVRAARELRSYAATYDELTLTTEDRARLSGPTTPSSGPDSSVDVTPETSQRIADLTASVVRPDASDYDAAIAIQNYLRSSGGYSYSLTLDAPVGDESPDLAFLRSKRGYCVQFATTMILMAQARGIPARMVIGFLPGTLDGDEYIVRSSDAHAWPELYFTTLGWVRFEPTPGSRTGIAPAWTQQLPTPSGSTGGPSIPRPSSTGRPVDSPDNQNGQIAAATDLGSRIASLLRGPVGIVLAIVALLAMTGLAVPLTAKLVRRRRRRVAESEQELVETQWRDLVTRLSDLGVEPDPTATLREARDHYQRRGHLDAAADEALGRVLVAVEQVRYAATPVAAGTATAVAVDAHEVVSRVEATRSRQDRIRAALFPTDGSSWWSGEIRRVTSGPSRVVDSLIALGRAFSERRAARRRTGRQSR
jgi:transglutaminase-like putative cysteine protease